MKIYAQKPFGLHKRFFEKIFFKYRRDLAFVGFVVTRGVLDGVYIVRSFAIDVF